MPEEHKGVEYNAPVKESQTREQLRGVTGKEVDQLRKLVKHELPKPKPSAAETKRKEALEHHMATSGTRRMIDAVCFVAYVSLGMELVLTLVGQAGIIQAVWWLPMAMRWPMVMVLGWIRPGLELGPVAADALALVIYAVAHIILRATHLRVTIQRMGLDQ